MEPLPLAPLDDNSDTLALNRALIKKLKDEKYILTPAVEVAFQAVPRHFFLPDLDLETVYRDQAIPTKEVDGRAVSSSSQPAMMAIMLEQLDLQPGHRVLEVGAGTGYNAALMAHIVGDTGQVITLDIDEDIVDAARQHLAAAGFNQVQVICGDGGLGHAAAAPYDRIILTVAAWDISPAWQEQLTGDGRLLLPLTIKGVQKSVAFVHQAQGMASVSTRGCGFMSLRGAYAGPERIIPFGPEPGLEIGLDNERPVNIDNVYNWLSDPKGEWATAVEVTAREVWDSLSLWLALHEPDLCGLQAQGPVVELDLVPYLFGYRNDWKLCYTTGLLGEAGLAALMRASGHPATSEEATNHTSFELFIRQCGPDEEPARRLLAHLVAWNIAGRPSGEKVTIRVYPANSRYKPAATESVVHKRWTQLVIEWHDLTDEHSV